MFFFEAKCNYLLPIMNLTVKFEPQAGNKFSYETVFTGIHFPYPRIKELLGKDPLSIVKVEIPSVGYISILSANNGFVSLNTKSFFLPILSIQIKCSLTVFFWPCLYSSLYLVFPGYHMAVQQHIFCS